MASLLIVSQFPDNIRCDSSTHDAVRVEKGSDTRTTTSHEASICRDISLDLLHTSLSRTARATAETRANSHVKHAPVQQLLLQMFELLLSLFAAAAAAAAGGAVAVAVGVGVGVGVVVVVVALVVAAFVSDGILAAFAAKADATTQNYCIHSPYWNVRRLESRTPSS